MRAIVIALTAALAVATAAPAMGAPPGVATAPPAADAPRPDYAREDRWAREIAPDVVVGDVVWLATPSRPRVLALYTMAAASPAKGAIIVVHGMGVNPDWGLVGVLRSALPDAGFATLSVQMPVLAAAAPGTAYVSVFPEAEERLSAARAWLAGRGYTRIAVVSHSLGAAMTNEWLAKPGVAPVAAWVPVGMSVPFARPPREPVLDVVAEHDLPEVVASAPARAAALAKSACSEQVRVAGANHYFERSGKALAHRIASFLDRVLSERCGA